jgi:RNA recognition motif-containing protein
LGARLFVDKLPSGTTEEALRVLFSGAGRTVLKVAIRTDRQSDDLHGHPFVEMASGADAAQAILALHGVHLQGQRLHVSETRRGGSSRAGS